jgi:hypothetical protein
MLLERIENRISLSEYVAHVTRHWPVVWTDDIPWVKDGRVLRPLAMPHRTGRVEAKEVRAAMREAGAWVALWNDAWNLAETEWWWVCATDPDYDIGSLPKKSRQKVRAGLRRCEVRRVEAGWLADHGYETYRSAFSRYGQKASPTSRAAFAQQVKVNAEYHGRETWGTFKNGSLVAFASCILVEDAVSINWLKSDPDSHSSYPNNALIFTLTHHYLAERGFKYVTGGHRAISHDTDIGQFLERMGFQRVFCPLRIQTHTAVRLLIHSPLAQLFGTELSEKLVPRVSRLVRGFRELERIARTC